MSLSRRQFIKASGVALCAGAAEGPCRRPAACAAGSAAAGISSRPAAVSDAAAFPLVVYPGTRAPSGDQWPLYGADDPRLERRRRQAYLQQPPDGERGDDHPRSAGARPLIGGAARMMSPNADWAPVLPIRQSAATVVSGQHAEPDGETGLQRSGGHVAGGRRGQQEPADP